MAAVKGLSSTLLFAMPKRAGFPFSVFRLRWFESFTPGFTSRTETESAKNSLRFRFPHLFVGFPRFAPDREIDGGDNRGSAARRRSMFRGGGRRSGEG